MADEPFLPPDPKDLAIDLVSELAERRLELDYGPLSTQAFVAFWFCVGLGAMGSGVISGGMIGGLEGAMAGGYMGMLFGGLAAAVGGVVTSIIGDALSRTAAAATGVIAGSVAMWQLLPASDWELRWVPLTAGLCTLIASALYREGLAWNEAYPRWRWSIRGLMIRTLYAALSLAAWMSLMREA